MLPAFLAFGPATAPEGSMNTARTSHQGTAGAGAAASKRPVDLFVEARRHSRRVRFLKLALPVAGVVATGLFLGATVFRPQVNVNVSTDGVSLSDGRIVMASPQLDGVTSDNKPYRMKAERAFQDVKTGEIELEKIRADMPFAGDVTAELTAATGWYDNANRKLDLKDGVLLNTSDGIVAKLGSANIDMGARHLRTSDPVDITTPNARITADSLEVSEGGKVLVFDRKVKMTIQPSALDKMAGTAN